MNDILDEKRSIVIFGQGIIGRNFHRKYFDDLNFLLYCDNDSKKHHTRCFGLDVISADELLNFSDFIVVVCVRKHYEVAQQLFNMGIKAFWMNIEENGFSPVFMDFGAYESLRCNSRRVCLIEHPGVGGSCYAIKKFSEAKDIDFLLLDSIENIFKNAYDYYAFHTSVISVTQGMDNTYLKPKIELWHGFPIKALLFASFDKQSVEYTPYINAALSESVEICSYSKLYSIFLSYCCGSVDIKRFTITGMPRNDLLYKSNGQKMMRLLFPSIGSSKVVLYAPTFRESKYYSYHNLNNGLIFSWLGFDMEKLENHLAEHDIVLILKTHIAELTRYEIEETEHIKILLSETMMEKNIYLYEMLAGVDLLISDYSSIWVDFLLLDKPIVFAVHDLEDYECVHGLMIDPFDAWAPGEIVADFESLLQAMLNGLVYDQYSKKRQVLTPLYHKYTDANSSQRVIALIEDFFAKEKGVL